uniref:Uncharacterized protein n=1 Tax=Timema shepardi TaxID=629360 RepID=A0A7R9B2C3_TIMSH|nr:unnamed protein product [Timema shepardi]
MCQATLESWGKAHLNRRTSEGHDRCTKWPWGFMTLQQGRCHPLSKFITSYCLASDDPTEKRYDEMRVLFFRDSLILATISLITAVIVQGLSSASMSPPDWVSDPSYRVIHSVIGHWILPSELRSKGNLTAEEDDEEVNSLETITHKKWRALATIVDRIMFIFFVFSFLSITLKFLI